MRFKAIGTMKYSRIENQQSGKLFPNDSLASIVTIADDFLQLLRQRQSDKFDDWLLKTLASSIKPLKTFAKGLLDDYAAVKASMMLEVSNGPVEGLNNKLKMLKRQMYGRASLDLLAKRFITPVSDY